MRTLIFTTMLAAGTAAMADISLGNGIPAAAPAQETQAAVPAQTYINMARDVFSAVKELTEVLSSIKDQASADAAAPQLIELTARMKELQKKAEVLPRPSAEVETQVRAAFDMQEVQQIAARFMDAFINIGMNNGYGSEALMNALHPVLNAMPGQQE